MRLFDMMNCTSNEFVKQRMYLEAVGLVKSFIQEGEEENKYVYRIFAPLTPKEFFEHALLCPLLKRAFTDESEFVRTKTQFMKSSGVKTTYKDITVQFNDVFKNLNRLENINVEDRYIGKVRLRVQTSFDFDGEYKTFKTSEKTARENKKQRLAFLRKSLFYVLMISTKQENASYLAPVFHLLPLPDRIRHLQCV